MGVEIINNVVELDLCDEDVVIRKYSNHVYNKKNAETGAIWDDGINGCR